MLYRGLETLESWSEESKRSHFATIIMSNKGQYKNKSKHIVPDFHFGLFDLGLGAVVAPSWSWFVVFCFFQAFLDVVISRKGFFLFLSFNSFFFLNLHPNFVRSQSFETLFFL